MHRTSIVFQDEKVGEVQYELVGRTEMPDSTLPKTERKGMVDEFMAVEIPMTNKNPLLERCKAEIQARVQPTKKGKGKELEDVVSKMKWLNVRSE